MKNPAESMGGPKEIMPNELTPEETQCIEEAIAEGPGAASHAINREPGLIERIVAKLLEAGLMAKETKYTLCDGQLKGQEDNKPSFTGKFFDSDRGIPASSPEERLIWISDIAHGEDGKICDIGFTITELPDSDQ